MSSLYLWKSSILASRIGNRGKRVKVKEEGNVNAGAPVIENGKGHFLLAAKDFECKSEFFE